MKKWFFGILLLIFGWVSAVHAEGAYQMKSGETLFGRFGSRTGTLVCKLNKESGIINDCNRIKAGQWLKMPSNVGGKAVTYKNVVAKPAEPACITLGVAPFNPEHNRTRMLKGIDLLTKLTPEKKELAKQKFLLGEMATKDELVGQQIFQEMLYQSTKANKEVKHVYGKPICSPEQGGQPEVMNTYDLGDGIFLADPRRCGNPSVFTKSVKPKILPLPSASTPEQVVPASTSMLTPSSEKMVVDQVASDYDWDAGLFVGGDKDVGFTGGDGAGYPVIKYYDWGRYALGGGGSFSLWQGGTPDGYRYSGETIAFGLAQKFSFNNRRDLGIKFPMYGDLWTRGQDKSGSYQQRTHASMICASASYTDASREKEGKTAAPEWQIWASFCDPFSQEKSHTRFGQALDASTIQDVKYVAGVGGRVFLSKNLGDTGLLAKVQPFVEVGVNQTAPNPTSAHAYVGLRTVDKVWGCGVGIHHAQTGNLPGATCTYDLGLDTKLRDKKERWSEMVKSLEALGVAVD